LITILVKNKENNFSKLFAAWIFKGTIIKKKIFLIMEINNLNEKKKLPT